MEKSFALEMVSTASSWLLFLLMASLEAAGSLSPRCWGWTPVASTTGMKVPNLRKFDLNCLFYLTLCFADGSTLLMIYCNSKDKISHLIKLGADVKMKDQKGQSAILRSFLHPSPMLDVCLRFVGF
jgi:hypothetical protein